jgi:hypothetical protein
MTRVTKLFAGASAARGERRDFRHWLLGLLLVWPCPAESHRLDEYLQATRIALARDRILIEVDLTPGVAVAPQVFAQIDRNGDDQVSGPEIEAYAKQFLRDLILEIDDRPYPLTLARAECPSWSEMRDGTGTIRLEATAEAPLGVVGRHRLHYENAHQSAIGAYLVNALVPSPRTITITEQRRDMLQHGIRLDVDVAPRALSPWAILPAVGLMAVLVYRCRRRLQPCA